MKMKTKKIVAKRFKVTSTGKILRRSQNLRHLRSSKSKRQIRKLKTPTQVHDSWKKTIKSFLPYS